MQLIGVAEVVQGTGYIFILVSVDASKVRHETVGAGLIEDDMMRCQGKVVVSWRVG